jgi:hypothetical protein
MTGFDQGIRFSSLGKVNPKQAGPEIPAWHIAAQA